MQSSGPVQTTLLLALLVVAAVLVRKGRNDPASMGLVKRQRIRPLALEWIDPAIAAVVVGSLLWRYLTTDIAHVGMGVLGAAIGVPIGLLRARVQFVRALPQSTSVILTRSTAEYLLLGLLIILKLTENAVSRVHSLPITLVLTALLALAVTESIARSIAITLKYRTSAAGPADSVMPPG